MRLRAQLLSVICYVLLASFALAQPPAQASSGGNAVVGEVGSRPMPPCAPEQERVNSDHRVRQRLRMLTPVAGVGGVLLVVAIAGFGVASRLERKLLSASHVANAAAATLTAALACLILYVVGVVSLMLFR